MKRWLGIIVVILGFAAHYGSSYIFEQIGMGEQQIASAQQKVKMADSALSLSPYTEPLGKGLSSSAGKKIQAGKEEIARYAKIAEALKTTSYVLFGLGSVIFILSFIKKKK
jgi:uncharacterized membrane protein YuzA (DUF378 family)